MVQGDRRTQVAQFEGHQGDHPEVDGVYAAGVGNRGNGGCHQDHRTERVHDHAQNHQNHHHQKQGRQGTYKRLRAHTPLERPRPTPPAHHPPFNLVKPSSTCPKCKAPIKAWQNSPVLSWL